MDKHLSISISGAGTMNAQLVGEVRAMGDKLKAIEGVHVTVNTADLAGRVAAGLSVSISGSGKVSEDLAAEVARVTDKLKAVEGVSVSVSITDAK